MITYEKAYKEAAKLRQDINYGTEFEKGYLFGNTDDENYTGGAGHTPVIILKKDGKAVNAPTFFMTIGSGEIVLEDFKIDQDGRIIEE